MKKRLLSIFLATAMLLSLAACAGTGDDASDNPEGTAASGPSGAPGPGGDDFDAPVFARAKSYGFVPEDLWENPDEVITMSDLCRLLSGVVALSGEEKLERWNELAAFAIPSRNTVQRDEAILAIFEAAIALGVHVNSGLGDGGRGLWWETLSPPEQDWWEGASWDYPDFPNWDDNVSNWVGAEMGVFSSAVNFAQMHWSIKDLSYMFPPDENWTFDFGRDVTRKDAIRAVTVFAESDSVILDCAAEYVTLSEAGTYDPTIITAELLNRPTGLPRPSRDQLPASWRGAGLSNRKDAQHPYVDFRESDIRILAENGMNFTRVFFDFRTLQYPYTNERDDEVNLIELRELDQLIAWGMEYGVHIQICSFGFLGYQSTGGNSYKELSGAEWDLFRDYWEMLAKRYVGIPSTYLSFDLLNEWDPREEDLFAYNAHMFGEIARAVWAADEDRVVLCSFAGETELSYIEEIAAQGIALGFHPYQPWQIAIRIGGWGYLAEPEWPLPWFGSVMDPGESITVSGDIGGGTLRIYTMENACFLVYADGVLYETIERENARTLTVGDIENSMLYETQIPEGTKTLVLASGEDHGRYIWFHGLELEKDGAVQGVMPHDWHRVNIHGASLYVDENGWSSADGRVYDAEAVYQDSIAPILEIAERYHVGAMANEMAPFGDDDLGESAYLYVDDMIAMLEAHGLGWCYNEMIGFIEAFAGDSFGYKDSPVGYVTYEYEDGRAESYWICEKMLDVLRKHTIV